MHNIGQNITQINAFFCQFSEFEPMNFILRTNTKIWVFEHMNCSLDFTEFKPRHSYDSVSVLVEIDGQCLKKLILSR